MDQANGTASNNGEDVVQTNGLTAKAAFPPKLHNDGKIRNVATVNIHMNAFELRLKDVKKVYKFELKFIGTTATGKQWDLSRSPKNDVAAEAKRKALWELYIRLIESDNAFFGDGQERHYDYVYDCGINFYSYRKLMETGEERPFQMTVAQLSDDLRSYVGRNTVTVSATLLACEEIDLRSKDRSVEQFLDILTSQYAYRKDKFHMFPQKMYEKEGAMRLDRDPRVLKNGMQKNVRVVGDSPEETRVVVQIDAKKAAFFPPGPLIKYLEEFLQGHGGLEQKLSAPRNFSEAVKQLKNLVVVTTHLGVQKKFAITALTTKGADKIPLEDLNQTVHEYFESKYNTRLKFKRLPCAVERVRGRVPEGGGKPRKVENFYPLEVLDIVPGQRVSMQKQTPQLVDQMIRQCQALPKDFENNCQTQRDKAYISKKNPHLQNAGVEPSSSLVRASAELLHPPAIVYGGDRDREEPQGANLNWKMPPNRKFYITAEPRRWAAVIMEKGVHADAVMRFLEQLVRAANNRGFMIDKPARCDSWDDPNTEYVRERLDYYRKNTCHFVMFFTAGDKSRKDGLHDMMKSLEPEFGMITQNISAKTVQKANGNQGANLVICNVLLKMHLKFGGVNYSLGASRNFAQANRLGHDIVQKEWLNNSRMFVGIDFSHAGPQSLYDRQSGQCVREPTVIGMAYTLGEPVDMTGHFWYQEPRLAIIQDLQRNIIKAMRSFANKTGNPPREIVIYRGGASEGEYPRVVNDELSQLHAGFQQLCQDHPGFRAPKVVIVVAQRHSNYRIVPEKINERGRPFEQNVAAGTVVDSQIMNPSLTEYLMVGHKTIQGTAHPVRYTVLADEIGLQLGELEYITYHLCYTHGIVCSPVSVPGQLYAAGDLAKRGRANWSQSNQSDLESVASGGSGSRMMSSGAAQDFFQERNRQMVPNFNTKFWA